MFVTAAGGDPVIAGELAPVELDVVAGADVPVGSETRADVDIEVRGRLGRVGDSIVPLAALCSPESASRSPANDASDALTDTVLAASTVGAPTRARRGRRCTAAVGIASGNHHRDRDTRQQGALHPTIRGRS